MAIIKPKRTSTSGNTPTTSDIAVGEIAINLADKIIYVRDTSDNILDLTTTSLADLGITATATELNLLDGVTATTTELNYLDGVTSNIQTQIDSASGDPAGTAVAMAIALGG